MYLSTLVLKYLATLGNNICPDKQLMRRTVSPKNIKPSPTLSCDEGLKMLCPRLVL